VHRAGLDTDGSRPEALPDEVKMLVPHLTTAEPVKLIEIQGRSPLATSEAAERKLLELAIETDHDGRPLTGHQIERAL